MVEFNTTKTLGKEPFHKTTCMLLNNLCEVFNGKLIDRIDSPIISCLEFIKEYMMKRICNVLKCVGPLTLTTTKIMENNETTIAQYIAEWCGEEKYQVSGPWNDQHGMGFLGYKKIQTRKPLSSHAT
uniref:Uncharacterized protein n=1 Tax=Lactuca sativa TaxID=4236 RepID=A0A9R1XBD1_LACSA|nr:hypothetical protein LSAT_V11C500292650 [Lactuca sativa]